MQFYRETFPAKPKLNNQALWEWEFLANPFNTGEPGFFIVDSDRGVHGAAGVVCGRLQIEDTVVDAYHPVNFFVQDEYKGFPALRLFRKVMDAGEVFYASYVSGDAAKLVEKAGFQNLNDHIKDYYYFLRIDDAAPLSKKHLRSVAIYGARRCLSMWCATQLKMRMGHRYHYRVTRSLDADMIPSVAAQCLPGRIGLVKDLQYLQWRYERSPVLRCRFIVQYKDQQPNCLVVVHEDADNNCGVILDVIRATGDVLEIKGVLAKAIGVIASGGYATILTTALGTVMAQALSQLGFGSYNCSHRFMFYAKDKVLRERLNSPQQWDFNLGDTDVY